LDDVTLPSACEQETYESSLQFGPLVISELEEDYQIINFDDPQQVLTYIEPWGLNRLILALKLQLPEKNLLMAVSEIITCLLSENRSQLLVEDLNKRLYPPAVRYCGNNNFRAHRKGIDMKMMTLISAQALSSTH
jgi:hypothetical protein